jgi:hypothetical protein
MLDHPIKQQPEEKQYDCPNPEMAALWGRLGWISSELVRRGGLGGRRLLVHSLFLLWLRSKVVDSVERRA